MANITKRYQFPVTIDTEDLKFRMYAALHVSGLSTKDLADYMGLRIDYIVYAMDGNRRFISLQFLVSFCAITRCSIADILPFANDQIPFPFTYSVPGGGAVSTVHPSPYKIAYSDPEDIEDRRWFGMEQTDI
jgi:DNA-binding Xre family transcriptional regulator